MYIYKYKTVIAQCITDIVKKKMCIEQYTLLKRPAVGGNF